MALGAAVAPSITGVKHHASPQWVVHVHTTSAHRGREPRHGAWPASAAGSSGPALATADVDAGWTFVLTRQPAESQSWPRGTRDIDRPRMIRVRVRGTPGSVREPQLQRRRADRVVGERDLLDWCTGSTRRPAYLLRAVPGTTDRVAVARRTRLGGANLCAQSPAATSRGRDVQADAGSDCCRRRRAERRRVHGASAAE